MKKMKITLKVLLLFSTIIMFSDEDFPDPIVKPKATIQG
jgi:hypothetical protein